MPHRLYFYLSAFNWNKWDQSDVVTQNAWFRCALCAAISGEISILIQTGAESWGRFPVPRICRWESIALHVHHNQYIHDKLFYISLSD